MIEITVNRTDPKTGREIPVPPEVLQIIERETPTLRHWLKPVEDLPLKVAWQRFEDHGEWGWGVELHFGYGGAGFGRGLWINKLREPKQAKEEIGQAVLFFATAPKFITGQILAVDGGLGL